MSVLPILSYPDPLLSETCVPISDPGGERALAEDMLETMYAAPGRGLAGPQVGMLRRIFVMDAGWKSGTPTPRVCINPEIIWESEERATAEEGCLSIPGLSIPVSRPARVVLRTTDLDGVTEEIALDGAEALIAQHETDHLNGILTLDRVPHEQRETYLARYKGAA